jgi:RNA polymerase sigma-70 factor (ECF subfamily)
MGLIKGDRVDRRIESFQEFYEREYRSLLGLAFVLSGSSWTAEDLTQDALTEAHRRWAGISRYDNPSAWVRRVMINKHRSRLRRLRTEGRGLLRLVGRTSDAVAPTERSTEVWAAVRELPARQAEAIALFYWEDMSVNQIADILEVSTETAKTHLKRGRAALADSLDSFRMEQR